MSQGTRPPRRNVAGRSNILTVARRLFMTRGYRGVSTREIAEAVGVTQPALYHHFGGKEALYVAVLEDELQELSQVMRQAARPGGSAVDHLAAMATAISERSEHDLSLMFHDLRFEVSESSRLRIRAGFQQALVAPMQEMIRSLADEGTIVPIAEIGISEHDAAMFVLGVIRTLGQQGGERSAGGMRSNAEIGALTARLVLNGLGASTR